MAENKIEGITNALSLTNISTYTCIAKLGA